MREKEIPYHELSEDCDCFHCQVRRANAKAISWAAYAEQPWRKEMDRQEAEDRQRQHQRQPAARFRWPEGGAR